MNTGNSRTGRRNRSRDVKVCLRISEPSAAMGDFGDIHRPVDMPPKPQAPLPAPQLLLFSPAYSRPAAGGREPPWW